MAAMLWLVVMLSWSLEDVNSQTFPYVSFRGQTLANHSYVDLSLVGGDDSSGSDSVQCHTDLNTCCSGAQGSHRGDWHFPNDTTRLPFPNGSRLGFPYYNDIYEWRRAQRVDLSVDLSRRNNANLPVGIYLCTIHTNDALPVRARVYVGLYTASGGRFHIIAMMKPILVSP